MSMVLTDAFISIDGVNYSGRNTSIALNTSVEAVDNTPMGSKTRLNDAGVGEWTFAAEFTSGASLFGLLRKTVPIEIRASSAPRSTSNPAYVGNALITEYSPIDGSFGDGLRVSISGVSASDLQELTA